MYMTDVKGIIGDRFIDPKEWTNVSLLMTHASVWFSYPLIICNIFILFIAISIKITIFGNYKEADECENQVERWIYLLKNMETLNRLPWAAQSAVFKKLESIADVGGMTRAERLQYDEALKKYRDTISVFEGVRLEGRMEGNAEGRLEEKIAIARNLKSMGMSISDVSKATGLSEEGIKALWIYCNSIIIVNVINYQCKTIRYKGEDYPFRLVWFDEYNVEVMISTVILSNQLFSSEGMWSDTLAEYIDNKIIYYVDEGEIIESDNYLQQLLKTNILW